MDSSDTTTTSTTTTTLLTTSPHFSSSLSSSANSIPPAAPPPPTVTSPCAACKILRRRCTADCVLAPYFPATEPLKFTTAHRVFGASNIIKFLQELPESRRADAVESVVYEANTRIRDPVYGCAGVICQLQKQASELQAQLAREQAKHVILQAQHANLIALVCMEMAQLQQQCPAEAAINGLITNPCISQNSTYYISDSGEGSAWEEPRWA